MPFFFPLSAESKKYVEDWLSSLQNTWCTNIHHCDPASSWEKKKKKLKNPLLWSLANKHLYNVNIVKKKERHWCDVRIWLINVESLVNSTMRSRYMDKIKVVVNLWCFGIVWEWCATAVLLSSSFESPNIVIELRAWWMHVEVWLWNLQFVDVNMLDHVLKFVHIVYEFCITWVYYVYVYMCLCFLEYVWIYCLSSCRFCRFTH